MFVYTYTYIYGYVSYIVFKLCNVEPCVLNKQMFI